jgi:hypothetical protein
MAAVLKEYFAPRDESLVPVPREQWADFLESFSNRHRHWLVSLETFDRDTGERVVTRHFPLEKIELDLEDEKNPRINVVLKMDNKIVKHIFFMPSRLVLQLSRRGIDEALSIDSLKTHTVVRFRTVVEPELVDGLA